MPARLEFSSFWHTPTHVQRFARTFLEVDAGGDYCVRLETCGGVRLWVDGRAAARFTPFTRNQPRQSRVPAAARGRAQRDHPAPGGAVRAGHHLVRGAPPGSTRGLRASRCLRRAEPLLLEHLAAMAKGCASTARRMTARQPVRLLLPEPAAVPLTFGLHGIGRGNAIPDIPAHQRPSRRALRGRVRPRPRLSAGPSPAGACCARPPACARSRKLAAGFAQPGLAPPPAPDPPAAGGRRWPTSRVTATRRSAGRSRSPPLAAIRRSAPHCRGRARAHRAARGLLRLLAANPALAAARLAAACSDAALRERARRAILGWRYWMDEPGNDVMWFWSENHALCFHTTQYLAGQAFPDDVFVNSGPHRPRAASARPRAAAALVRGRRGQRLHRVALARLLPDRLHRPSRPA